MKGRALVTGASSGIGRDLAELLARDGYDLVLTARSEDNLAAAAAALRGHGVDVRILPADLSRPGSAARILGELDSAGLDIDILVNNAGRGVSGAFWESPLPAEEEILHLHMHSLVELTKPLLRAMVARGRGRILNVASTAAFQPGPLMAVYYATKAFVVSLSEALWEETRGTGVSVTVLCPGPTGTRFLETAGMRETALFKLTRMASMRVARSGYRAMMAGRRRSVPGAWNLLSAFLGAVAPRAILLPVVRRLQRQALYTP